MCNLPPVIQTRPTIFYRVSFLFLKYTKIENHFQRLTTTILKELLTERTNFGLRRADSVLRTVNMKSLTRQAYDIRLR